MVWVSLASSSCPLKQKQQRCRWLPGALRSASAARGRCVPVRRVPPLPSAFCFSSLRKNKRREGRARGKIETSIREVVIWSVTRNCFFYFNTKKCILLRFLEEKKETSKFKLFLQHLINQVKLLAVDVHPPALTDLKKDHEKDQVTITNWEKNSNSTQRAHSWEKLKIRVEFVRDLREDWTNGSQGS